MWSPCPRTEPAGRAPGQLFASGLAAVLFVWFFFFFLSSSSSVLFLYLVLLLILPGPHLCFRLNSKFSLFSEFPVFAGSSRGEGRRGEPREFNVEL